MGEESPGSDQEKPDDFQGGIARTKRSRGGWGRERRHRQVEERDAYASACACGKPREREREKEREKTGFARSALRVILRAEFSGKLRQDEPKRKHKKTETDSICPVFLTGEPATSDHRTDRPGPNSSAKAISEQNLRKEEPKKGEGMEDSTQEKTQEREAAKGASLRGT